MDATEPDLERRFAGIKRLYGQQALARFTQAHVCVLGIGGVGSWAVEALARSAIGKITLIDLDQACLNRAIATITKSLDRLVKKERITTEAKDAALGRISTAVDLSAAAGSQLVIEAVTENLEVKVAIFEKLAKVCGPETVLASNTSSLPITKLAATTNHPDLFVGMHFMNPVPMMKLVEIIRGMATSDETFNLVSELSLKLNKTPVEVNDYPGFIANRIRMPMINEASYAHMEGVGTVAAIDEVMKLGMGHPMGPLTLADFIGLDVCLAILEVMHDGLGDPKYRPCPLLRKMVQAGYLGRKSGRGFYLYD